MKLLILSTTDPMVRRFIGDLAKEWAKNGHEVHILTPHSVKTLSYEVFEGVHIHRFHYLFREEWETLTHGDGIPQSPAGASGENAEENRYDRRPFLGLPEWFAGEGTFLR